MTNKLHRRWVLYLAVAILLAALPAAAQDVPNMLVVVDTTDTPAYWNSYVTDPSNAYNNVQMAINDAVTRSRMDNEPYTVLIVARNNSAPWAGGVDMPADANVRLLGVARPGGPDIFQPVLDGGGLDVITIGTASPLFENNVTDLEPNNPRVEGLRLKGGRNGISILGDNPNAYRPTINRCWMDSNAEHGVSIKGDNAQALLINCSISDNGGDGVHIDTDPLNGETTFTDILHCSIIENADRGVYVHRAWSPASGTEPPKYARVRNTIVYKNGSASSKLEEPEPPKRERNSGGLVWSNGITIIPEYDVVPGGATATIYGENLVEGGADTRVYFGPRDIGAHNPPVLFNAQTGPDRLVGSVPPAYNSAPGKVDVHIVRAFGTDQERTYTLEDGFTYVEEPSKEPQVTLVTPAHGPVEGGNWVLVEGLRFNVDCEVWFDFNGNGRIDETGGAVAQGPNGNVDVNTFTPYNPDPVWTPDQYRNYYLLQGSTRWLIASNTTDTLTLVGSTTTLFDGTWSIVRPPDLRANQRTWLSSALLHVEAPAPPAWYNPVNHNSEPMHVLVRNLYPTGARVDSPPGEEMTEYQYRMKDSTANAGVRQPDIIQITPNFYRRLNTDTPSGRVFRADIVGWNLDDGCSVRIGGVECPYTSVSTLASGLPQGDWRKIIDVQIPLSEFGAGGSYDVEVTNPSGLYDILPTGFTYFPDSTPMVESDDQLPFLPTSKFDWFPSNFMDYNLGPLMNSASLTARTLLGDGFDAGLRITFDDLDGSTYIIDDPLNNPGKPGADGVVMPHEKVEQHVRHSQRSIEFAMPARPDDITVANAFIDRTGGAPYVPAFNTAGLHVVVENVRDAHLGDSYGSDPLNLLKRTSSPFYWITQPDDYFELKAASYDCADGTVILSVAPSASAGPGASVFSWTVNDFLADDIAVFVGNHKLGDADILSVVPEQVLFNVTLIECSLGSLPSGFYGQKDVTVVLRAGSAFNPLGRDLYSTMKDAIYVPPSAGSWRLYGRAVAPRTVPAKPLPGETFQVRVLGSGLAGPYPYHPSSNWPWTDVELRWGGTVLSLASVPEANYTVFSFYEALFTVFDAEAYGLPISSPGNVNPVDVALVTYDACTGLPVKEDVIKGGIIFWDSLPRILATNVSPHTERSGAGGIGGTGTFTVTSGTLEPGAYGGHYLLDASFNAFMILTNTDDELTLYGGSPVNGAWRIERGAYPENSGPGGTWNAAAERFTAAPDPGWGALAGLYLIDSSNQSFLITDSTSNTLTLHHTVTPPANGGWRIVQPVHWGPASGGDVLNVEGADFPMANMPHMRIGPEEARVMTYNSGHISVRTPPAPFDLPGTYDVSSVWLVTAAGNTQPTPVEARAPRSEWFTYVMDGPPKIVEIEPSQIFVDTTQVTEPMQDPTQYITITGYNFDDRVIVTFTFTDESSANPTTVSVPLDHFSVSPNKIVISAPDFMTLLDPLLHPESDSTLDLVDNQTGTAPPDGLPDPTSAGNHYEVSVTVTNYVDDSDDLPLGLLLEDCQVTSNPRSIYYVVDNSDLMTPLNADLRFNDVYLNYRDYVNVHPGTGSIAVDPMLLPEGAPASLPWWRGKLEVMGDGSLTDWERNQLNPVRDKAGKFIDRPFTETDYELEGRPDLGEPEHVQGTGRYSDNPRLPDIGADEILGGSGGGELPYWYYAEVVPNPVPAMPERTLQVQVRFFGIVPEDIIYIVPQGVDFGPGHVDFDRSIPIELQDYGDGIYFGTNIYPIRTVAGDIGGDPSDSKPQIPPTQGAYLNDGHAAIVVPVIAPLGLGILGDTPHDLTDGGIIVEQAILGRHFLIDTVPPRPVLTVAPAMPVNVMALNNAPGLYAAQGVTLPNTGHPYGPVTGAWRPLTEPSPPGGPFDQFLQGVPTILPVPPLRGGTQAFFNVGSISNGYVAENLNITIGFGDILQPSPDYTLAFIDEPPRDAVTGDIIQGNPQDRDYYSGEYTREASGFPLTPSGPVTQTDHTLPPTVALFVDSTYVPAIGELTYEYRVSSQLPPYDPANAPGPVVPNRGFDRNAPRSAYIDQENSVVASRWTFTDGASPGINYGKVASGSTLHMGMQFVGEDQAGNVTGLTLDEGDALDPLHVWWMTRVQTVLLPNIDGGEVEGSLPFYWYIDRPTALEPQAQDLEARPRFIYRFWVSEDFMGPYSPLTLPPLADWSPWTPETLIDVVAPNLVDALPQNGLTDTWILMVVLGADEAGNYELWPDDDLILGVGEEITINDRTRKNWLRFKLTSGEGELDTTVTYELWHNGGNDEILSAADGDINFGAAGSVTRPDPASGLRVEALFRLGVVMPPNLEGPNSQIRVAWSLKREGLEVAYGTLAAHPDQYEYSGEIRMLQIPGVLAADLDHMPAGRDEVSYVFEAFAFLDENNNDDWDPRDLSDPLDPGEMVDSSPATVHFKVVRDTSMGDYIGRQRQRGKQQIILREE
ncbi:MAG: right-handed parallel beta-helix repeat-containing protein [Candidatus Hydrogenedentales bacterium]|jgi:hypothetical protein